MKSHFLQVLGLGLLLLIRPVFAQRQIEALDRGLVVVPQNNGQALVSWRLLASDPDSVAFNVYRDDVKLNREPISDRTNYLDPSASPTQEYTVRPVMDGNELPASIPAKAWGQPYLSIPLQVTEGYQPNDASVGDLDGDGQYEIVLHQAGRSADNSRRGLTSPPIFEAYELDGTRLWQIQLGTNIREGAHYTQFMVYDLDGDGKAEFACKTADGTIDGTGQVIGDPNAHWVDETGMILRGPEYLTVFDGLTGQALATTGYVPQRHPIAGDNPTDEQMIEVWGDDHGNRMDRYLACVAYLDGRRPSLVMCRGYYTGKGQQGQTVGRTVLAAWNWRDGQLSHVWTFDTYGHPELDDYRGQGNHALSVADIDDDGKDEILYGAIAIDDNGTGLYTKNLSHGDAQHTSDLNPNRPGLETWSIHENPRHPYGAELSDSRTGEVLWGLDLGDTGRGLAMDIDPRYPGAECWTNNSDGLYSITGEKISDAHPSSCNMGIWWDGDLLREILDGASSGGRPRWPWGPGQRPQGERPPFNPNQDGPGGPEQPSPGFAERGSRLDQPRPDQRPNEAQPRPRFRGFGGMGRVGVIDKWDYQTGTTQRLVNGGFYNCVVNNGSKSNPCLCADILGDWREEVIWRTNDGKELRIFSTSIPTEHRITTLMHDPVYRLGIAWQNVGYNQPAHTRFFLGYGMSK